MQKMRFCGLHSGCILAILANAIYFPAQTAALHSLLPIKSANNLLGTW
jgi:hypothetical protein